MGRAFAKALCGIGSRLSGAGRNRRSSEYTEIATAAEDRDLAERVEAAEVDEDHVHHVGPAAFGYARSTKNREILHATGASSPRRRALRDRCRRQPRCEIAGPPGSAASAPAQVQAKRHAPRQPAQAEKDQHGRDDLDEQLRQREVGRRKPDEGDAGDETCAAGQHQRRQPVIFCLPRGADRARGTQRPGERERGVERGSRRSQLLIFFRTATAVRPYFWLQ